jgi:spore cortex formation protein SpoVR/YcgB (stage V sporulation)
MHVEEPFPGMMMKNPQRHDGNNDPKTPQTTLFVFAESKSTALDDWKKVSNH